MSVEQIRTVLIWCAAINYGILLLWFCIYKLAHDWMQGVYTNWLHVPPQHFDTLHIGLMILYKLGIVLFNLVPAVVLFIV